jgi:hypothetical protein
VRSSLPAGLALIALLGCGPDQGVVEVYWQFEDANLDRVYPLGYRTSTCAFTDRAGDNFDVGVQLTIAHYTDACAAEPSDPSCHVVAPKIFGCLRARGTLTDVPPSTEDASETDSDPGYLMIVEPVIMPENGEAFVPISTCIARPGPRVRRVRAGRIADLEVHEFIMHALDPDAEGDLSRIDLEACRSSDGDGDGDGDTGTDSGTDTSTDTGSDTDTSSDTGTDTSTDTSTDTTDETDTGTDTGSTT